MRDAGCSHGQREAALWLIGFLEDAGFQAEEFDLEVDVEVVLVHCLGGFFDGFEGLAVVALTDLVFDCKEGD